MISIEDYPRAVFPVLFRDRADDALAGVVEVVQGRLHPVPELDRDYGRGNHLRMRVRKGSPGAFAMVLENHGVLDPAVAVGPYEAGLVCPYQVLELDWVKEAGRKVMGRRLYYDLMNAHP